MQIQINTDSYVKGPETFVSEIKSIIESTLSLKRDHVTRVEVHLKDESRNKQTPNGKRCVMEARIVGHRPIAVSHHAETIDRAVDGAANKLTRLIDNTLAKLKNQKSRSLNMNF